MPSVDVTRPIEPGSIVVIADVEFDGVEAIDAVMESLARAAGHEQFAVLTTTTGGAVEVWGGDSDVAARVTELLIASGGYEIDDAGYAVWRRPQPQEDRECPEPETPSTS